MFEGGKLKPGIYKIQSNAAKLFADVLDNGELCGRSADNIAEKVLVCERIVPPMLRPLIIFSGKFSPVPVKNIPSAGYDTSFASCLR